MKRSRVVLWSVLGAVVIAGVAAVTINALSGSDDNDEGTLTTAEPGVLQHQLYVLGDSYSVADAPWYQSTDAELHGAGIETEFTADVVAGTGYISGSDAGTSFADRVAAGAPAGTELTIVFGGNDELDRRADEIYDAAMALYAQLYAAVPHTGIVVVGPVWPAADAPANVLAIRDALQRAAKDSSAVFYDPIAQGWFTGDDAGLIGTDEGQAYMGVLLEPEIRQFFSA